MSLATGYRVHSNQWTVLSVGDDVIERVHNLAKNGGQPKVTSNFKFEWRSDGEGVIETEQDESDDNEEEVAKLMMPVNLSAPVIMEVDEKPTSAESIKEEVDGVNVTTTKRVMKLKKP